MLKVSIQWNSQLGGNYEYIPGAMPIVACGWPGRIICAANWGGACANAIVGLIIGCMSGKGVEATAWTFKEKTRFIQRTKIEAKYLQ